MYKHEAILYEKIKRKYGTTICLLHNVSFSRKSGLNLFQVYLDMANS